MRIGLQMLLGYVLVAILACYLVLTLFIKEVKPMVINVTETMLIDTASLLSSIVSQELNSLDQIKKSHLGAAFDHINDSPFNIEVNGVIKNKMIYRVYITDAKGIVVFDSDKRDGGKDFSRWNDVYLTLNGKYGARISRENIADQTETVMYVAAPIKIDNQLVGVLTVSKPTPNMSKILNKGEKHILIGGGVLIAAALLIGFFIIWWINRSIRKLVNYAQQVSNHEEVNLPKLSSPELRLMGRALENMRLKLDGKDYIEKYVHNLAHEIKSPLSSIRAATEILQDNLVKKSINSDNLDEFKQTQQRFLINIERQTERMTLLIERMLQLARLESRVGVNFQTVNMQSIIQQVIESKLADAHLLGIELVVKHNDSIKFKADKFLLIQAISNLLSNALDFTSSGGMIIVDTEITGNLYTLQVIDTGAGIPDFALDHVFERFYSLPRPNRGKSSGLGLAFVKEVAHLHNGNITISNRKDNIKGVVATLTLKIH